jgi:hypothetical protein
MFRIISRLLGGLAVFASLVFVGYEIKRNNDLAVVQSQQELLALSIDLKAMLTDPDTLSLLMATDAPLADPQQELLFMALVGAWFDIYELVLISREREILTDEQFVVWINGMCTLPKHWLESFETRINTSGNYLAGVSENVSRCLGNELLP